MNRATAFSPSANPDAYVPDAGAERALDALRSWAFDSTRPVVLLGGAPGMGKTLLLKVFGARARVHGRFESIYVPNPDCDPSAFCRWVLRDVETAKDEDSRDALDRATAALRERGKALLILVDDAESLPPDTATWLFDAARASGAAMRLLLALTDEARLAAIAATLGADAAAVRLDTPLSRAEVEAHIRSELDRAAVEPPLRACFDTETIDALHARSAGVPALLQNEAAAILFRAELRHGAIRRVGPVRPGTFAALATRDARRPGPEPSALEVELSDLPAPGHPLQRTRTSRAGWWTGLACGVAIGAVATVFLSETRSGPDIGAVSAVPPTSPSASVPSAPSGSGDNPIYRVAATPADPPVPSASGTVMAVPAAAPRPPSPEPALPPTAAPAPPRLAAVLPPNPPLPSAPIAETPINVSINAEPWAEIDIDGRAAGETPIAALPIAPGRHRFEARMPDGRIVVRAVDVHARNRRIVFR